MSLGAMRGLGPRSLDVTCNACGHRTLFDVDDWPDEVLVSSFGPRMRCARCGHLGASVRPHWSRLHTARRSDGGAARHQGADRQADIAMELLGADPELLSIVGSWRDTLDDAEVLSMLREYNATGKVLHPPQ
jgi:hypothetical protein